MSLFGQVSEGDEEALLRLLEQYSARIRGQIDRQIPRRFQSVIDADDILQQTFVDAIRSVARLRDLNEAKFAAWLRTLARRNLIDVLRSLETHRRGGTIRRVTANSWSASASNLLDIVSFTSQTPSRAVASRESIDRLQQAISGLPQDYRLVVERYDLSSESIEEIAASLGRSVGAVFMLRKRAHRMLSDLLKSSSA